MTDQNDHPVDLLPELALGVLAADEAARVEEHLAGCEECSDEYAEMRRVAQLLPFAAEELAPAPSVRAGLLERIAHEPQDAPTGDGENEPIPIEKKRRSAGAIAMWASAIAAGLALTMIVGGFVGYAFRDANPTGTERDASRQGDLVQAFAEGTVAVSQVQAGGLSAKLLRAPGQSEGFAWVSGLPSLPAGKAYQAWFTKDGKSFEPSDTFTTNHGGTWLGAAANLDGYSAMAFTIEDSGGATQPTQAPFAVVDLKQTAMVPLATIHFD